jgi:hypothetical protein
MHYFAVLLACESVDRSTFCMKRASPSYKKYASVHAYKTTPKKMHMIIKEMFYIPIKLKPELARASMTTSDVNNQWRSNFQQQII